jgi:hypothetical protein
MRPASRIASVDCVLSLVSPPASWSTTAGSQDPSQRLAAPIHDSREILEYLDQQHSAIVDPLAGVLCADATGCRLHHRCHRNQNGLRHFCFRLVDRLCAGGTGDGQGLAFVRGLLGLTEAAGLPAAVKTSTEWFPAKERSVAIGWFNIGSSIGAVLAPPLVVWAILHSGWELAFLIVGGLGVAWTFLWMIPLNPRDQKRLSDEERDYILSGQEDHFKDTTHKKGSWKKIIGSRNYAIASAGCSPSRPGRPSTRGSRCT